MDEWLSWARALGPRSSSWGDCWGRVSDNKVMWPRNNPSIWQNYKQYTFLWIIYFLNKSRTTATDKHYFMPQSSDFFFPSRLAHRPAPRGMGVRPGLVLLSGIYIRVADDKGPGTSAEDSGFKHFVQHHTGPVWLLGRHWHPSLSVGRSEPTRCYFSGHS